MPHTPPFSRRQLGKEGAFDEDVFFNEVTLEAGISDTEVVKRCYLAMVRVLNRRLVTKHVCRLPHLGDFALPMQASKSVLVGKKRMIVAPKRTLKFYAIEKWTKHISNKLGYNDRYR